LEIVIPSARWTFFDPAPPRFAAKTKLALRAQTVVFAGAALRGQGPRKISNARFRDSISKLRKGLNMRQEARPFFMFVHRKRSLKMQSYQIKK